MFRNRASIITLILGAILFVALGHVLGANRSELVAFAIYGMACSALVVLLRESWVPFDVTLRNQKPPSSQSTVDFDGSVAGEDGRALSETPMARVCAVVMVAFAIVLIIQAV